MIPFIPIAPAPSLPPQAPQAPQAPLVLSPDSMVETRFQPVSVAASVSSVEVYNNTRGKSAPRPSADPGAQVAVASGYLEPLAFFASGAPGAPSSAAFGFSSPFLAQLFAQTDEMPPGIMLTFDQLKSFEAVKYKPSNAALPEPEPAGVFARVLKEAHAVMPTLSLLKHQGSQTKKNAAASEPDGVYAVEERVERVAEESASPVTAVRRMNNAYQAANARMLSVTALPASAQSEVPPPESAPAVPGPAAS